MNGEARPSGSLTGLRVLITRPEPANGTLAEAVTGRAGQAIRLPAIETKAIERAALLDEFASPGDVGLVIFVSVPAVTHGSWLLREKHVRPRRVAAIGGTTANALEACGVRVDITPENDAYTSEDLLAHPSLTASHAPLDVLIVRGVGGRELLANTLSERGFHVRYAETYVRRRPSADCAVEAKAAIRSGDVPHIITATSLEILDNALLLLGAEADAVRGASTVLAPSERIAHAAVSKLGFELPPLKSRGADNEALIRAMEAWWGTRR
ncbi:MAG: uroporphyrinogen-III synthase [Pseudomonadota bacterium]